MDVSTAKPGDRISVDPHRVGGEHRHGEIVEVLGDSQTRRLRVRWDDGEETIAVPGSDMHLEHEPPLAASSGSDLCLRVLTHAGIHYELLPHSATQRALDEATTLGVAPSAVAKTVVLSTSHGRLRAVLPASERLSLPKLREFLGEGRELRLASESELTRMYPMFTLGAVPPFGGPSGDRVIVDHRIARLGKTFIEAGERDLSVEMRSEDLVAVTGATVTDIVED
jgi:Ala-tRNA(Pro) deacylase